MKRSGFWLTGAIVLASGFPAHAQTAYDPGKGALTRPAPVEAADPSDPSHSKQGAAFDQGPRRQAHLMKGVGNVHFPITTAKPDAQLFFDQGVNLLYSFSWFEAERSFRQAAMLDPGCAMAYWGLAMADAERGKEFIKFAQAREAKATDRERRYIDALAINFRDGESKAKANDNIHALEALVLAYPDDVEAKALLAWALKGQQGNGASFKVAIDSLLKQVLAKNPLHPGANHYRIHMWDGPDAEEALDSCRAYAKAAPNVGHAQHMPGHIYARLGRFLEATEAMDAATRAERRYCYEQGEMPFESWDYLHNQDFLLGNIGYTGRIADGEREAQELLGVPRDPQFNSASTLDVGRFGMLRMRVRGERWDEILNDTFPVGEATGEKSWRLYGRGLAFLGKGDRDAARKALTEMEGLKAGGDEQECARLELRGRLAIANGDFKTGLEALKKATETETAKFPHGDPIPYPHPIYESLAWGYLQAKQPQDAEAALRVGLAREPGNGFALALLLESLLAQNRREAALTVYEPFKTAWSHADADLPALKRVQALGLDEAGQRAWSPTAYKPSAELARHGPAAWRPFPAADFALADAHGKTVHLSDFQGRNVLLVFYLGNTCLRCAKQLQDLVKDANAFADLNTEIVAVSSDPPNTNLAFLAGQPDYPLHLLSDPSHAAARKFKAYDEFENLELHAAILITKNGDLWWYRSGSLPFTDDKFLKEEIARMDAWTSHHAARKVQAALK